MKKKKRRQLIKNPEFKFDENVMGLSLSSTDMAKYIKIHNGSNFLWKNKKLYCFNDKFWEQNDLLMRKYIGNEFCNYLLQQYVSQSDQSAKKKEDLFCILQMLKLKNNNFKNEVLKTTEETLTNNDIKFDNNPYIFCFCNTVYELTKGKFRNHQYNDFTLTTTCYDWREPTEDEIKTVNSLLQIIMPNDDEREHILRLLATGLEGKALEKIIIWNGGGRNGKGLLNDLFLNALGNYGMIGNNSLLTDKSRLGAQPELANIDGKRYVVFREVPETSKFENSKVKELTGGGTICARNLYEQDTTKTLNLTLVVEVNKKPAFRDEITVAEMERLLDEYFGSTFVTDVEDVNEKERIYLANPLYKNKEWQDQHKFALLQIIFHAYKRYYDEKFNLKIPKSVKDRTRIYLEASSDIVGWFYDRYEKTENIADIVKLEDMFDEYSSSEYYKNLTKEEKRRNNRKNFYSKIQDNLFLKKYYCERKKINDKNFYNVLIYHKLQEINFVNECLI